MVAQTKTLTKLELCNLYGINALRFSGDKGTKRKSLALLAAWGIVLATVVFYVSVLTYSLICLGLEETVPSYLITISGFLVFVFGILKAGSILFRKEGYDILCALPVTDGAVVASRLVRMYVEDLLMILCVLIPGCVVYVWQVHPEPNFYLAGILGIWSIPLIPMTASVIIGTVITGVASRMRHKSLVAAGLSILAVLGIMYGSSRLSSMEESINPEMLKNLSGFVMTQLKRVYPPAVWLGTAISGGDSLQSILCGGLSVAVFAAAAAGVAYFFRKICQGLYSSTAKHNYQMGTLKAGSVPGALCKREFRRYFSSSVYVTNTIIGPIMGCILSGALLVTGTESLQSLLGVPLDLERVIPFVVAAAFCMMTTTAVSVSMEGKNWWIVKSLPLSTKQILDAKILMNLLLILPFYLLSELFLVLALRPVAEELLWLICIPAVVILFSCVYGITINLYFPVLEWENEVRIVKQSASSMLGGMGGFLLAIVCAVAVGAAPVVYSTYLKGGLCIGILGLTAVLYRKNSRFDICGKV